MTDFHHTGWDPHQELITAVHNIGQLVQAVQHASEVIKEMGHKMRHQQEVIEQLMFQNQKINQTLGIQRIAIERLTQELQEQKKHLTQT